MVKKDCFNAIKRVVFTHAYNKYPQTCSINLSSDLENILFCGKDYSVIEGTKIIDSALDTLQRDGYINIEYKDRFRLTAIISLTEKGLFEAREVCMTTAEKVWRYIKNKFTKVFDQIITDCIKYLIVTTIGYIIFLLMYVIYITLL